MRRKKDHKKKNNYVLSRWSVIIWQLAQFSFLSADNQHEHIGSQVPTKTHILQLQRTSLKIMIAVRMEYQKRIFFFSFFSNFSYLSSIRVLQHKQYYSHFTDEETWLRCHYKIRGAGIQTSGSLSPWFWSLYYMTCCGDSARHCTWMQNA